MNTIALQAVGFTDTEKTAIEQIQCQLPSKTVPHFELRGKSILDIGCGTGKDFLHPVYTQAKLLAGIDFNPDLIRYGQVHYPRLKLAVAPFEAIPFGQDFDIVVSKVALPYSNIPAALREIHRVLKPEGLLHITMHDWRMQFSWLWKAIKGGSLKRAVDHGYIVAASLIYALTGRCIPRPWNGTRETFQPAWRLRRSLEQAGFREILIGRTPLGIMIQAVRT